MIDLKTKENYFSNKSPYGASHTPCQRAVSRGSEDGYFDYCPGPDTWWAAGKWYFDEHNRVLIIQDIGNFPLSNFRPAGEVIKRYADIYIYYYKELENSIIKSKIIIHLDNIRLNVIEPDISEKGYEVYAYSSLGEIDSSFFSIEQKSLIIGGKTIL